MCGIWTGRSVVLCKSFSRFLSLCVALSDSAVQRSCTRLICFLCFAQVSVSGLFKGVKVSSVREASLGLLEVGEGQAMETLLPPMEMKAFKLTLDR